MAARAAGAVGVGVREGGGSGESGCAVGGLAGTSKRKWLGHDTSPAGGCRRGPGASPAPGTAQRLLHGALVPLGWAGGCSGGRAGGDGVVGCPCTGDRSWRAGQRQQSVHPWGHGDGGGHGPSFPTLDGTCGCRDRRRGTPAPLCPPARLSCPSHQLLLATWWVLSLRDLRGVTQELETFPRAASASPPFCLSQSWERAVPLGGHPLSHPRRAQAVRRLRMGSPAP